MPNFNAKSFDKLSIDECLKKRKKDDLKIVYRQLKGKGKYHGHRVGSKILKMDKNNRYGQNDN